MIRLLIVVFIIVLFIIYLRKKNIQNPKKAEIYKYLLIGIIVLTLAFLLATSGKFIIPKIFQILKALLPFITKFIV